MDKDYAKVLKLIVKLMDETDIVSFEMKNNYSELVNLVNDKLPIELDEGSYISNANIIRKIRGLIERGEIFTLLPEMTNRNIIAIWGERYSISDAIKMTTKMKVGIGYNSNLPVILLPMEDEMNNQIYCITYMNKLVSLSFEEYKIITGEIYKYNIDIQRIIKGFVICYTGEYYKEAYLVLPEYVDKQNELLCILDKIVSKQIVISEEEKTIKKLSYKLMNKKTYFLGSDNSYNYLKKYYHGCVKKYECDNFKNICAEENIWSINYPLALELENIFLDIMIFYSKRKKILNDKVKGLAEDSVKVQADDLKKQIKKYRKKIIHQLEGVEKSDESIRRLQTDAIKLAYEVEKSLGKNVSFDNQNIRKETYINVLLQVFFKHINAGDYNLVNNDILKLEKINYEYVDALRIYIKRIQGVELKASDIEKVRSYPDNVAEIAKIKIELKDMLKLKEKDVIKLMQYIHLIDNGEEYFYQGCKYICEKEYYKAAKSFMNALENGNEEAGIELIKLAKKYPECKINIEELAENLVAEANYYIGKENISKMYRKGIVNLKMAASQKHILAIEMIAGIMFDRYKKIPWQKMEEDSSIQSVCNVIKLYEFLDRNNSKELYLLRIGLMYCKLGEYARAYRVLKDIKVPEAQYECAKMCQYGNGVAKDLKKAKKHYEQIECNYKDVKKQYEKVCNVLKNEGERKKSVSYNEEESYSSRTEYYYSYDESCFTPETKILMSDGSYRAVKNIKVDDWVVVFDHYKGIISKEQIVANIHNSSEIKKCNVIKMIFENGTKLDIVKSHAIFDLTDNQYVWIDNTNINNYVGHEFAFYKNGEIIPNRMIDYLIEMRDICYYAPISRLHMNVFAENILTMPPIKIAVNMFKIGTNMQYDLSILDKTGITLYSEISKLVSQEEYEDLPCKYLSAVLLLTDCTIKDFEYAIKLYRE